MTAQRSSYPRIRTACCLFGNGDWVRTDAGKTRAGVDGSAVSGSILIHLKRNGAQEHSLPPIPPEHSRPGVATTGGQLTSPLERSRDLRSLPRRSFGRVPASHLRAIPPGCEPPTARSGLHAEPSRNEGHAVRVHASALKVLLRGLPRCLVWEREDLTTDIELDPANLADQNGARCRNDLRLLGEGVLTTRLPTGISGSSLLQPRSSITSPAARSPVSTAPFRYPWKSIDVCSPQKWALPSCLPSIPAKAVYWPTFQYEYEPRVHS